uniref:Uncharacterized protein n=1 Tax=Leersia perrieri TaxID=77586 RepID=A0A0D9WSM5_9ORYZ
MRRVFHVAAIALDFRFFGSSPATSWVSHHIGMEFTALPAADSAAPDVAGGLAPQEVTGCSYFLLGHATMNDSSILLICHVNYVADVQLFLPEERHKKTR